MQKKILITGGLGQIGEQLTKYLRSIHGSNNVILTDMREAPELEVFHSGPFQKLNVCDGNAMAEIVKKEKITTIYHLAALLSGRCEEVPDLAWDINLGGLRNVLKVAHQYNCQVFHPSTIGVFGKFYNPEQTIQDSVLSPVSIYGITKVAGENLCNYYADKYGVDTRGIRYPGILSSTILGGGTTDYAVYMLQHAVKGQQYDSFLLPDTRLDMMYIDDAIEATVNLMDADPSKLIHRNAFNITGMNFTPHEFHQCIKKFYPNFEVTYQNIDQVKQRMADSWPKSMVDTCARMEWGFSPKYDMEALVKTIILELNPRANVSEQTFMPTEEEKIINVVEQTI